MNWLKKFFKEIKRVRWPKPAEANKTFFTSIIFIATAAIILFIIAIAFTALWNTWGVGLNG